MIPRNEPLRLALTTGEPAGIGPDIVLQACLQEFAAELIVISDPDLLKQRARQLNLKLDFVTCSPDKPAVKHQPGLINILPVSCVKHVTTGIADTVNAKFVLQTLQRACQGCEDHEFAAMVTAPVQKSIINQAGITFTGHTEYLAGLCQSGYPVMMLADNSLRVALATTHLAVTEISRHITADSLTRVIRVIWNDLRNRFAIPEPRILVCGLNPHAGEEGHLGREEIEVITPTLETLRQQGMQLIGPVPADTAFTPERLQQTDVVLAMYHDQGLPVLKARGFGEIVNITLGLPIIRTSVDHGTALELAGTGKASHTSMVAAIHAAIRIAESGQRYGN